MKLLLGRWGWVVLGAVLLLPETGLSAPTNRLRLIIETDAGGDPDDEQSLVRFLLYANEWDVEGIIANRPVARDGENLNLERTGLGIVRRLIKAYGNCHSNLVTHDPRFPTADYLWKRTVAGDNATHDGEELLIRAVDSSDPRPLWYSDWGTDSGAATNNLKRVLDRILRERGAEGYARFKSRLRLSSSDKFGGHTAEIAPPFPFWVDTWRPEMDRKRWYHRFSALTARAGGFDVERDVRTGHGPLGALYPTNTTHWCKEGDTASFLYLIPNGLGSPDEPGWGSWAGRYGPNTNFAGRAYYWANLFDTWNGATNRDNTLLRWAKHLQNDFKARMDWCVTGLKRANHPPVVRIAGLLQRRIPSGHETILDASASTDPDGDTLEYEWLIYPEAGNYRGPPVHLQNPKRALTSLMVPRVESAQELHLILVLTDQGTPPLTRYERVVVKLQP